MERRIVDGKYSSLEASKNKFLSISLILNAVSYFSKSKVPEVLKCMFTFVPFITKLSDHSDACIRKDAVIALSLIFPTREVNSQTNNICESLDLSPIKNPMISPVRITCTSPITALPNTFENPTDSKAVNQVWSFSPLLSDENIKLLQITMWEADVLICRSVELFYCGDFDVLCRTCAFSGQVGLRCIYCKSSPFKKVPFSTVFPG